jgi:hypothetical protein
MLGSRAKSTTEIDVPPTDGAAVCLPVPTKEWFEGKAPELCEYLGCGKQPLRFKIRCNYLHLIIGKTVHRFRGSEQSWSLRWRNDLLITAQFSFLDAQRAAVLGVSTEIDAVDQI